MHPVVRVVTLIVLAVGLADAAPAALLLASLALVVVIAVNRLDVDLTFGALRRLRWILLSVIILYAWLLPGEALLADAAWSPSREGLTAGICRAWMLLVMAVAARVLMRVTPREQLLAALHVLLTPFRFLGLDPARFCLRLVLTLEYAIGDVAKGRGATARHGSLVSRAVATARTRLDAAEERAARAPLAPVRIPRLGMPAPWQWLVPAGLLLLLWAAPGAA